MAAPRTSVEPPRTEARQPGEGLSVQTLIIAAFASGIAAVVVSYFWARGTILFSAMTPVAVAIISEMLKKPVESERLRGSVRAASSIARPRSGRTPKVIAPPPRPPDERPEQRGDDVEGGPVRVYSSGTTRRPRMDGSPTARRRVRLKVAVVTGLAAFLIAAAALTLPEIIFGGSVGGGGGNTTYFGGGEDTQEKGESQDGAGDGQKDAPAQQGGDEGPQGPGSGEDGDGSSRDPGGESTAPETAPSSPEDTGPTTPPPPSPAPPAP